MPPSSRTGHFYFSSTILISSWVRLIELVYDAIEPAETLRSGGIGGLDFMLEHPRSRTHPAISSTSCRLPSFYLLLAQISELACVDWFEYDAILVQKIMQYSVAQLSITRFQVSDDNAPVVHNPHSRSVRSARYDPQEPCGGRAGWCTSH